MSSSTLTPGISYTAQISARQADGTYRVSVDDPKVNLSGVRLAFPAIGGFLGFHIRSNLTPLTKVKLVYGTPAFIYAVIPTQSTDVENGHKRSILWGPNMDGEVGVTGDLYSDHAEDLLEGEAEFGNLYGVSLQFLTTLMRMTAGDRAAVECHLINDMVRVISGQWRHISGLGEDLIFDHGRPTMERAWSSYRHEVLGALKEKEPYAELKGDEVDREALEAKRVTALGRHRFREFLGFAGDFIHSFVSDPSSAVVSLAQHGVADNGSADSGAGKSWIHRNSDGSIIMQSVADIRLERVVRIPVPVRYAHHEDPLVTSEREYDSLAAAYLKLPQALSPADPKDVFQLAYHIRSYSRWIGRYHAFARMLQLPGDYAVPSEAASPTPDWRNAELDRLNENGLIEYYDAYACITILRDGSILTHDGYGSSIVMSNGNVQVSAARHIDLEAAGDIRMVAGGSILMKARRNIELSAAVGGLILHSYAWMKMLCEKGTLWLRSNAAADKSADAPTPKSPGSPTPEIAGWESGVSDGYAILVEATDGAAAYRSLKGVTVAVDGTAKEDDDTSFDVNILSNSGLTARGSRSAALQSSKDVLISADRLVTASPTIVSNASTVLLGPVVGDPSLVLRNGKLWCREISSDAVRTNTVASPSGRVATLKSPVLAAEGGDTKERGILTVAVAQKTEGPALPWGSPTAGPRWAFPAKQEYQWDDREKAKGAVPETLTQQYLRLDAITSSPDRWGGLGYSDWEIRSPLAGKRVAESGGFGYYELQYKADDSGESLHAPSATAPADIPPVVTSWKPKSAFTIKYLKREGDA